MSRSGLASLSRAMVCAAAMGGAQVTAMAGALAGETKPSSLNPCAQYGAGFSQVPGTSTCMRAGSYIRLDAGRNTPLTNAPGAGASGDITSTVPPPSDPWKQSR